MASNKYPPIRVRYNGLFDFDGLYAAMTDWAKNYGYLWEEESYKHKVPSPKGAEQEWLWFAEKNVTDYIHYKLMILGHIWDMTEVEKEGKRKKLTNGRFEIIIIGTLTTDWQKKWGQNKFSRFLGRMYEKYVMVKEIETIYGDQLWYRMWNLQAVLKKFFDMQTKWHEYKRYLGEN